MLQGLNNLLTIKRATEGAMDAIGHSTATEANVYTAVKCRVSYPNRGDVGRLEQREGVDVTRLIKCVLWPAKSYSVRPGDIVIPALGPHATHRFIVLDVKEDSLLNTSPRSHIELICERYDYARTNQ